MDYIEQKFNEFIQEVKTFEHSYPEKREPYEELVVCWKSKFDFFILLEHILGFIEDSPILFEEYSKRVKFLYNVLNDNNKEFLSYEQYLFTLILEIWHLLETDEQKKEQEKEFLKNTTWSNTEYYNRKLSTIFGHNYFEMKIKNIDDFITIILNKESYNKINTDGFVKSEIDKFLTQYHEMIFPTTFKDKEKYKNNVAKYKKAVEYVTKALEPSVKIKAHEFMIFNYFSDSYRKASLTSYRGSEAHSELECAMNTVDSVDLVSFTLKVLESLKDFYLLNNNKGKIKPITFKKGKQEFTPQELRLLELIEDNRKSASLSLEQIINGCNIKSRNKDFKKKNIQEKRTAQNLVSSLRKKTDIKLGYFNSFDGVYPINK